MKHILIFLIQMIILGFMFIPVILKFVWTFEWDDTTRDFPFGLKRVFKNCVRDFKRNVKNKKIPQSF
jgi:hypothetical protein